MRLLEAEKQERLAQLYIVMDKLKFYENNHKVEDIEYLYRYVYDTICTMDQMKAEDAIIYCKKRLSVDSIRCQLQKCNIKIVW